MNEGFEISDCFQPLINRLNNLIDSKGKSPIDFYIKETLISKIEANYSTSPEESYKYLCLINDKIEFLLSSNYPELDKIDVCVDFPLGDEVINFGSWNEQFIAELNYYKVKVEKYLFDVEKLIEVKIPFKPIDTDLSIEELGGLIHLMEKAGYIKFAYGQKTALSNLLLSIFKTKSGGKSPTHLRNSMHNINGKIAENIIDKIEVIIEEAEKIPT